MSNDGIKAATLAPCNSPEVMDIVTNLIGTYHRSLDGAHIKLFWLLGKGPSEWGGAKALSELEWWLSGGDQGVGVDIAVRVNQVLWERLSDEGRIGYLDLLLFEVARKTAGQTVMSTETGDRNLYVRATDGGVPPDVVARRPALVAELEKLRRLHMAMTNPAQYALDFGEVPPPTAPAISRHDGQASYRARHILDYGPVALMYSGPGERVADLIGVHHFEDDATMLNVHPLRDLPKLEYDMTPMVLRTVSEALDREQRQTGMQPAILLDERM